MIFFFFFCIPANIYLFFRYIYFYFIYPKSNLKLKTNAGKLNNEKRIGMSNKLFNRSDFNKI